MKNQTSKAHYKKYYFLSKRCSPTMPVNNKRLLEAYKEDNTLSSIPLKQWDNLTPYVNIKGSLSEKVCTLKHIAIYKVLKLTPYFTK